MKPVYQTQFGSGRSDDDRPLGNCFTACIASLLELPIAQVPHFYEEHPWVRDDEDCNAAGWAKVLEWLHGVGWTIMALEAPLSQFMLDTLGDALLIGTVRSTHEAYDHAVLGRYREGEWVTVHDPDPRGGVVGTPAVVELLFQLPGTVRQAA